MGSAEHGRPARLETTPLRAHTAIEMASEYDTYVERLVKPIVTERRIRWIWQIWCYALVLFLVTGGVASFLSGSPRLLLPILGVCFTGGVVGTLVAILRSISEYEHLAKVLRMEDKIIRRLNATESDDQM